MIKIKYLILAFILLLIPNLKVNAAYVDVSGLYFNNKSLTTTNYISATAYSNTFKFDSQTSGNGTYYRFIFCMDSKVNTWSDNVSELTDVNFIYTNNSCSYYNSTYTGGKITYLLATYTPGASASFTATITFNAASNFSLQLINASASEIPFNIDTSQDYSDVLDNLKKEQEKTQETIKETFEDCEDAKNISFTTINGYDLIGDGNAEKNSDWLITSYIPVKYGYSYTQSGFTSLFVETYDSNYKKISSLRQETFTITDSRVKYIRLNSYIDSNLQLTQNKNCSNKIDKTNDKLDSTNDKLDDLNSSINDGDIDNNSGKSFFDSFSSSDHGGISGIITAPLVAIKKMLDKNCSPLTATYKGKEISLPCGYEFWAKMPAIKEFINLTLGGLLCYNIIRKLYHLIENMKNPDDDRVEVMKL